jgi:SnoaL-like domain
MIDYTRIGGSRTGVEDTKTWLSMVLGAVERFDLFVGDSQFEFAADRSAATVSTTWHGLFIPANDDPVLQVYGHYEDRLVQTDVWRIAERVDFPASQVIASLGSESSASTT